LADGPLSGFHDVPTTAPYWALFQALQPPLTPICTSYPLENISFIDNYVAIADDWTVEMPFCPNPLMPWCWGPDLIAYLSFLTQNAPGVTPFGGFPINTSWYSIDYHSHSNYDGTPALPLVYELFHGDQGWGHRGYCESLLAGAPPCGPYDYEAVTGGPPNFEWSGNDRLSEPYKRQGICYGDNNYDAEFNGLDYMMLFNLYSLERGGACSGCGYLQGMINPYYCVNYNVNYPDGLGYGSYTEKLKLNWLEYISAINTVHYGSSPSTDGWLDFRAAKVIDLKPGFRAEYGSFFLAHIKDYNCNGGNVGDGPYEFAQLNPTFTQEMPVHSEGDSTNTDSEFHHIMYFPQGEGYYAQKLPDANPANHYWDSVLTAHPEIMEMVQKQNKYNIINSNINEDYLNYVKQLFGWNDDTITKYKIPANLLYTDSVIVTLFPNPASDITYLSYQLSQTNSIFIKLTNALGQDFSSLIEHYDAEEQPGTYKTGINVNGLTPGIYYLSIKIGGQTVAKKLTVIN